MKYPTYPPWKFTKIQADNTNAVKIDRRILIDWDWETQIIRDQNKFADVEILFRDSNSKPENLKTPRAATTKSIEET